MKKDNTTKLESVDKTKDNVVDFKKAKKEIDDEMQRVWHLPSPIRLH